MSNMCDMNRTDYATAWVKIRVVVPMGFKWFDPCLNGYINETIRIEEGDRYLDWNTHTWFKVETGTPSEDMIGQLIEQFMTIAKPL